KIVIVYNPFLYFFNGGNALIEKVIVGADEAGRGLIIGPMIIGACAINEEIGKQFKKIDIKDSKKYSTIKKLFFHADIIKKQALAWSVKSIPADVLSSFNKNKMTMDEAEAYAFFRAIEEISQKVPEINTYQVDNFQAVKKLEELLKQNLKTENTRLIVTTRAESKYIAVSAGSVLARAESLKELETLKKKYGDFGSGSTSDKKTIQWLKDYYTKNRNWPEKLVRTYWKTITVIEKEFEKER
ncbi:MAG: ribonuclease HII, partial [Candidatus Thorarchaeota archaeon]